MKHEELITGLRRLHLHGIAKEYAEVARLCEKQKKTFEQYLASLVTLEIDTKKLARIKRLNNQAALPKGKVVETYDYSSREGITKEEVNRLVTGQFIKESANIVLYGDIGVGKSHLAEGITKAMCDLGYSCLFISVQKLITNLSESQKALTLGQTYRRYDKYDLIALDELGYTPTDKDGANLFFQLLSQRYERKSVIITTNLTYSEWDQVFVNPLTAKVAVDRIIHKCETFNIRGPSWRAEEAKKRQKNKQQKTELASNLSPIN